MNYPLSHAQKISTEAPIPTLPYEHAKPIPNLHDGTAGSPGSLGARPAKELFPFHLKVMSPATPSNHPASRPTPIKVIIGATLTVVACAAAGWAAFTFHGQTSSQQTSPQVAQVLPAVAAPSPAMQPPAPDPRFLRVPPLTIPAVTTPEGQRMVLEMQDAYRCMHSGSRRTLPSLVPPSGGDDLPSFEALSASLQQSLATMPDACYVAAALPQIANPRTPSALMTVLYRDVLKRPDSIRLRTLFLIAGIEAHPMAEDALENLRVAMHADYQRDWSRWEQAVAQVVAHDARGMRAAGCRAR